jgi:hypothetical protein
MIHLSHLLERGLQALFDGKRPDRVQAVSIERRERLQKEVVYSASNQNYTHTCNSFGRNWGKSSELRTSGCSNTLFTKTWTPF